MIKYNIEFFFVLTGGGRGGAGEVRAGELRSEADGLRPRQEDRGDQVRQGGGGGPQPAAGRKKKIIL